MRIFAAISSLISFRCYKHTLSLIACLLRNKFNILDHGVASFWSCRYFIDPISHISATIQSNSFRGGYHVDFRGLTTNVSASRIDIGWEVEFFCENEGVISTRANADWRATYYTYLNTKVDSYTSPENTVLNLSTFWTPGMGELYSNLPEVVKSKIKRRSVPDVSILEKLSLHLGERYCISDLLIGNPSSECVEFIYVYQDAAYLWFPRASQETVIPFVGYLDASGLLTIHYEYQGALVCDENKPLILSGNADFTHGVCAALLSVAPASRVGNIDRYIGFEEQVVVDNVAYSVLDIDKPLTIDHQPAEYIYSCADIDTSFLRNIFFWVDGLLDGYEVKEHTWGRLMIHQEQGFQSEAALATLIGEHLVKLKLHI